MPNQLTTAVKPEHNPSFCRDIRVEIAVLSPKLGHSPAFYSWHESGLTKWAVQQEENFRRGMKYIKATYHIRISYISSK